MVPRGAVSGYTHLDCHQNIWPQWLCCYGLASGNHIHSLPDHAYPAHRGMLQGEDVLRNLPNPEKPLPRAGTGRPGPHGRRSQRLQPLPASHGGMVPLPPGSQDRQSPWGRYSGPGIPWVQTEFCPQSSHFHPAQP